MKKLFQRTFLFTSCLLVSHVAVGSITAERLRCEYLDNPLGIDESHPRLSWIVQSNRRGEMQSAYQILVASSEKNLKAGQGDLWDSGKVDSDKSVYVVYSGKALEARQECFWKVRVWDNDGKSSSWSKPAKFEMALLTPGDWQGKWIARTTDTDYSPAPFLRRAFSLDGKIKKARAYICGLGYYELHINGKKIGDHVLDPGYTRFDRRDLYVIYDVTDALRRGDNAVGVILGTGWFNVHTRAVWDFHKAPWRAAPKLLAQIEVEFSDGKKQIIATDDHWKTSTGPTVFDSIYGGETYDARLEQPGWDSPKFDDSKWALAKAVEAPKGKLSAQTMAPIKVDCVIKPIKITEPQSGVYVYDLGQNFAGFPELTISALAGTKISMKTGERLGTNGLVDQSIIAFHVKRVDASQQFQTDTYICKGGGTETWHSRFDYHGFQYVEVTVSGTGVSPVRDGQASKVPEKRTGGTPMPLLELRGYFIHSAIQPVGEFACSNPLLNRIWQNGRWSYLSNLQGIPTDCPHREKNGWTGDANLACEQGLFNYDGTTVYEKWVNDLDDEQKPTGELPGIVPTSGWGYSWGNGPAWDSAFLLVPFYNYEYCGDARILEKHFDGFKRYVDYLTTKAKDGIVSIGLNDWAPVNTKTPADITSTGYYYIDTLITARTAELLGKKEEAEKYFGLAERIKKSFNRKFFNTEKNSYGNGSQTSLSCALYQGFVEPENRQKVLANLVTNIEKNNDHIDTGILGAKYLLNALTENGRADVAYKIATQRTQPSWGWWIDQGATTLWEQWNGDDSRNHIMYGDICAWFYKTLAGINPDPRAPGFKHFIIKPIIVGDLKWTRGSYNSVHGRISSEWKIEAKRLTLKVTIPANTTATVYFPSAAMEQIQEHDAVAASADGVKTLWVQDGKTVMEVGSGSYEFSGPAK